MTSMLVFFSLYLCLFGFMFAFTSIWFFLVSAQTVALQVRLFPFGWWWCLLFLIRPCPCWFVGLVEMERDFLGLNSKEPLDAVKRENTEEETQWPFMEKAWSFPHFMSFKSGAGQDDGMNKMVADAFDHGQKSSMGKIQNFSLPVSNSLVKPSFASSGQNVAEAIMRQQFQGAPVTVAPPVGKVVGFTEPWCNLKSSAAPGQMTIFYAGTVSVYDGITPDKAQAIMLLAGNGNGSFLASNMKRPSAQVQSPAIKAPSTVADGGVSNQPMSSQPGIVSASKDEKVLTNTTGISSASVIQPEHQTSRGSIPMPAMVQSAVPQFRKASLARFLEKRKERMMSTAPYSCEKKPGGGIVTSNSGTSPAAV